jgi:hypothetical protein
VELRRARQNLAGSRGRRAGLGVDGDGFVRRHLLRRYVGVVMIWIAVLGIIVAFLFVFVFQAAAKEMDL